MLNYAGLVSNERYGWKIPHIQLSSLYFRFKGDEQCPGYPYFRCCNINKERTQLISKSKFPKKEETYKQKATRVYTKSLGKSQTFRSKRSPQNLVSWITNQAANIINNPLQNVLGFSHNQIFQNQQQLMWPTTVNSGFNQPQYFLGQTNTNTVPVYNQLSLGENYPPSYLTPDFPGQSVIYNPQTIVTTSPGIISVVPEENLDTNFGYSLPNQINTTPQILPVVTKQNYVENTTPVSKPTDPSPAQDIDSVFDITKPNKEKGDQKTLDEIFNVKNDNKPSLENKSRQVLKDADGDECTCVVYYQCREETGQIITDGTGILDVR